jgi:hypothetical protein
MMRDYKIKQTEWPRQKKHNKLFRIAAALLTVLAIGLLGYVGIEWWTSKPDDASTQQADPRVIPLTIPPRKSSEPNAEPPG